MGDLQLECGNLHRARARRSPPRLLLAAAGLLCLGMSGCAHPIEDGAWRLEQARGAQTLDSCGLLDPGGALGEGRLLVTGVEVRFSTSVPGLARALSLIGRLKSSADGEADELALSGSAGGEPLLLGGASCPLRFGQLTLEATVEDERSFAGVFAARYELEPSAGGACPAVCEIRVGARGAWQGP